MNGGFELGLLGWYKVGGELRHVASPVRSGAGAGALESDTTSTKWAYQVVSVEGGSAYEFSGWLMPGSGVQEAFLRISWYASTDGGGSAIATSDSAGRVAGPRLTFERVSTGSVAAPAGARSARVRVMLAPEGAGFAALYMDDLSFGPATAPPRPAATASSPAGEEEQEGPQTATPSTGGSGAPAAATPSQIAPAEGSPIVRPTRTPVTILVGDGDDDLPSGPGKESGLSAPVLALGALALLGGGIGAAHVYSRRRP